MTQEHNQPQRDLTKDEPPTQDVANANKEEVDDEDEDDSDIITDDDDEEDDGPSEDEVARGDPRPGSEGVSSGGGTASEEVTH